MISHLAQPPTSPRHKAGATRRDKMALWLWRFTIFNIVALGLLWLVERFVAEQHWTTTLLTYLPQHPTVLPTLFLGLWSLFARRRLSLLFNTLTLAAWLLTFGGFNIPLQSTFASRPPAEAPRMRVMSYNILLGLRGVEALAQEIRRQQPDVVCLQEATYRRNMLDPVPVLQKLLPGYHVARRGEVATFSRFPIVEQRVYDFPAPSDRAYLETVHEVQGRRVHVYNVHLTSIQTGAGNLKRFQNVRDLLPDSITQRGAQFDLLLRIAQSTSDAGHAVLLVGDFNTPPRGRLYSRLASRYEDAFCAAGWGLGYTFHSDVPVMRIDYVWANSHWQTLSARAIDTTASDHRPLVVDLALRR
jgi:endonuclease/exonuclease/phosphatase (EEP) superfamily protein YafD